MKQNRKFMPMIALGLTALLSVGNAGEAVWGIDNVIDFTDSESVAIEDKVLSSNDYNMWIHTKNPSIVSKYNGTLSLSSSSLDIDFFNEGTELYFDKTFTISGGRANIVLDKNNIFSVNSTATIVLNGGNLYVDVLKSTSSNFVSSMVFSGGDADFYFDNSQISYFGAKGVGGRYLKFNTSTNSGKAIFSFADSNTISFDFNDYSFNHENENYVVSSKPSEDVLLSFLGSNNKISFITDFTNLKIEFDADSGNNTFVRRYNGKVNSSTTDTTTSIRWIQNNTLGGGNNTIVSFPSTSLIGQKLVIGSKGEANTGVSGSPVNFIVGVNASPIYQGAVRKDTLIIHAGSGTHNLGVKVFGSDDFQATTPLLIASAVSDVTLNPIDGYVSGFTLSKVEYNIVKYADENGNVPQDGSGNYTSYFLTSAKNVGVAPVNQSITSSALALNYDLFIGNFNSLNKRMGELRDNPYSEGMWGRIFNGQISNDFSGSKNNYTTIQMGYDHKLGELSDASNYLGFSVSYLLGLSDQHSIDASSSYLSRSIKDVISNGVEIALYNSYIQDNGWFSDTIAKFSYLTSDFNILDNSNSTSEKESTSNIAFTLSQEFGYRFKLGETQSQYIDPQAELALGYFSGTDLKQVAGSDYLDAKSDSMTLFRARVGTAVGYDFKDLTSSKDFNAKLYVGLSYEADFISGGDVTLTPNNGSATKVGSLFGSDGRGVLNVGTNLEIKEYIRMYADIQTSFGGKITNDYQVNFGVRYSFGEGAGKETPKPNSL